MKYKAFISYSHDDEKIGKYFHQSLGKYKIPKKLYDKYPNLVSSLYPIFRDRYELSAGDDLSKEIPKALKNSDALIIICSKKSASSKWVNKEIVHFKKIHGEKYIFPVIVDGIAFAKESSKYDSKLECFPEALKYKIDNSGELTNEKTEILASNIIKNEDGRELGKLKLIAGLLGIELGVLHKRDEEEKKRARNKIIAIVALVALLMGGLAFYSFIQKNRAENTRDEAEKLIEYMLFDLKDKLEPIGRLEILEDSQKAIGNYYTNLNSNDSNMIKRRISVNFGQLADIYKDKGDLEKAKEFYQLSLEGIKDISGKNLPNIYIGVPKERHGDI